jgi:hypothetical protein
MTQPTSMPGAALDVATHKIDIAHRQAVLVNSAIGGSIVVYAAMVELLRRALPAPVAFESFEMLRVALFAIAGVLVFTSTVLKGTLLRNPPASGDLRIARLRTTGIITAAFAEVPVIIGLVLFILGRQTSDFYILVVVSIYMLVRHFPRREQWENYVRRGGRHR